MTTQNDADHNFGSTVVMPWSARAKELEESEGPYCDYAAFCEWLEAWNDQQEPTTQIDIDELDKTSLYVAFFAACAETAKATEQSEVISRLLKVEHAAKELLNWYDQFSETGGPVQRIEALRNILES